MSDVSQEEGKGVSHLCLKEIIKELAFNDKERDYEEPQR